MQAIVHLEHEFVKVDAALPGHRRIVEEEVHQHGLAAADRTPDVKTVRAHRLLGRAGQTKPRQQAGFWRFGRHGRQLFVHGLQAQHDLLLHRVGADLACNSSRGKIGDRPLAGRASIGIHYWAIPSSVSCGCL